MRSTYSAASGVRAGSATNVYVRVQNNRTARRHVRAVCARRNGTRRASQRLRIVARCADAQAAAAVLQRSQAQLGVMPWLLVTERYAKGVARLYGG